MKFTKLSPVLFLSLFFILSGCDTLLDYLVERQQFDNFKVYDPGHRKVGEIDNLDVYDSGYRKVGYIDNRIIYDAGHRKVGSISDGKVYNSSHQRVGYVEGNKLYSDSHKLIGYTDVESEIKGGAAILLLLINDETE